MLLTDRVPKSHWIYATSIPSVRVQSYCCSVKTHSSEHLPFLYTLSGNSSSCGKFVQSSLKIWNFKYDCVKLGQIYGNQNFHASISLIVLDFRIIRYQNGTDFLADKHNVSTTVKKNLWRVVKIFCNQVPFSRCR